MNVGELKRAIAELPDDMPVLIAGETGAGDEPNLYVIPANVTHHTYGSHAAEGYASPQTVAFYRERGELVENTSALLLSEWGNDEGEDITPRRDHAIIDGEVVSAREAPVVAAVAERAARFGAAWEQPLRLAAGDRPVEVAWRDPSAPGS